SVHASAVSMDDGVIGFLAPKHFGKSTLAMTMYRAGAPFVTDDTLPIIAGADVVARPGVHSLRVRVDDEGSTRLAGELSHLTPGRDGKIFLPPFPTGRVLRQPAPLAALYFLRPV